MAKSNVLRLSHKHIELPDGKLEAKARLAGLDWEDLDCEQVDTETCPFCKTSLCTGEFGFNWGPQFPPGDEILPVTIQDSEGSETYNVKAMSLDVSVAYDSEGLGPSKIKNKTESVYHAYKELSVHCREKHPEKYVYFLRRMIQNREKYQKLRKFLARKDF